MRTFSLHSPGVVKDLVAQFYLQVSLMLILAAPAAPGGAESSHPP